MTQSNGHDMNGHISDVPGLPLGMVVEGSVANGVEIRLDPGYSVEQVKVGTFVTIQGADSRYFGVVTDASLGSSDPRMKFSPLPVDDPFVLQVLQGAVACGAIVIIVQAEAMW